MFSWTTPGALSKCNVQVENQTGHKIVLRDDFGEVYGKEMSTIPDGESQTVSLERVDLNGTNYRLGVLVQDLSLRQQARLFIEREHPVDQRSSITDVNIH